MVYQPLVSVLLPIYNGERYASCSIESMLRQTFSNFELLIINDGSSDGTADILEAYAKQDRRIQVYHQENQGLIRTLNRGLSLSSGIYVARMDADDVSHPDRLKCQVGAMQATKGLILVGTFYETIDSNGEIIDGIELQTEPVYRLWRLMFHCNYAHGSVMFVREAIVDAGGYSEKFAHAEDYDLWLRICNPYNNIIIPRFLFQYRVSDDNAQVSQKYRSSQIRRAVALSNAQLRKCNPAITDIQCAELRSIYWDGNVGYLSASGAEALGTTFSGFSRRFELSGHQRSRLLSAVVRDAFRASFKHGRPSDRSSARTALKVFSLFPYEAVLAAVGLIPGLFRRTLRKMTGN